MTTTLKENASNKAPNDGKSRIIENLHILTLFAFAVAQPLYSLLGTQTGFFTANQMDGIDVLLIVLILSLGLALPFILIRELSAFVNERLSTGVQGFILLLLLTAIFLPLVNQISGLPDGVLIGFALVLAGVITFFYLKKPSLRSLLTFLSPTVLIFPLLFLFFSDATAIVFEDAVEEPVSNQSLSGAPLPENLPPIVMVVLDELPLATLLDEKGNLDALRYPNFAQLAQDGTWYKNTYTVGASTLWAVPAIVSSRLPSKMEKHSPEELSNNLFTLFGATHQFNNVSEKHTALCPSSLCKARKKKRFKRMKRSFSDLAVVYLHIITPAQLAKNLPDVSHNWGHFAWAESSPQFKVVKTVKTQSIKTESTKITIDKPTTRPGKKAVGNHKRGIFHKFVRRIKAPKAGEKPSLNFLHILMPHVPYNYMPSGKHYRRGPYKYFTTWKNEGEMFFDYQRHVLQVGATDALLGDLMAHLKELNMYDDALIVVVADHGANWGGVGEERRKLTRNNYANLIQVPLFIKAPHQQKTVNAPAFDKKSIRTLDILPTIAEMIHMPLAAPVDGQSLLQAGYPELKSINVMNNQGEEEYTFALPLDVIASKSFKHKQAWFGSGASKNIFSSGPNALWVGKTIESLPLSTQPSNLSFQLASPEAYETVDLDSDFIPALIEGQVLSNGKAPLPKRLAIVVNGVLQSAYPLISRDGDERLVFGGLVAEESFKAGKNTVRLFAIQGDDAHAETVRFQEITLK